MSALGRPFTESVIQDLARGPDADPTRSRPGGFSYPQRGWMYRSATAWYEPGGTLEAMWATLDSEIRRGKGLTPWKIKQAGVIREHLRSMIAMDREESTSFVRSRYLDRPEPVTWRGHELAIRVGLEFTDANGPLLRMLWTERRLNSRQKGLTAIAAAILAVSEASHQSRYEWIETWHLREQIVGRYSARDVRPLFASLDKMLTSAEARWGAAPAA